MCGRRAEVVEAQLGHEVLSVGARGPRLGVDDATGVAAERHVVRAGVEVDAIDERGMDHPATGEEVGETGDGSIFEKIRNIFHKKD